MNFPFELILIILFFVLPALGSIVQRLRGQQPPTIGKPRGPQQGPQGPSRADTSTRPGDSTNSEVPRWLEEAQRRVREAQQNETGRGRGRTGPQPGKRPQAARPLVSSPTPRPQGSNQQRPAPANPATASLEDYRPKPISLETIPAREVRNPVRRAASAQNPAPPLRVQRVEGAKGATLSSYKMRFDKPTLMTGFVWHQILSPPLSQTRRTRLSRRRP